jgi:NAD(P)-dependent dehydrogenase (short-subunit alcohol dehydrogenase family)
MELRGKVALVTGAGSGIGRASASRLARAGVKVGLLGRTADQLETAAEDIRRAGGDAMVLVADVAESDQMQRAVADLVAAYGRLDIVVANAGINGVWAPIDEITPEEWSQTVNINLNGAYLTVHHAVPHLKRAGAGSIVLMSSINGTRVFSTPGASAYASTKAAQLALAQMLALELAKHKIRVNAICPGRIDTEIGDNTEARNAQEAGEIGVPDDAIPLTGGVSGKAEDVAALVEFLCSDAARHITGTPVWIDGGQSLLKG